MLKDCFKVFDSGKCVEFIFWFILIYCFLLKDNSGTISSTELRNVLKALGIKCSTDELKALMKLMDSDS